MTELESVNENARFARGKIGRQVRINFEKINQNFTLLGDGFEMVNTGSSPGDGTGDTIREAWKKVNRNFARLAEALDQQREEKEEAFRRRMEEALK